MPFDALREITKKFCGSCASLPGVCATAHRMILPFSRLCDWTNVFNVACGLSLNVPHTKFNLFYFGRIISWKKIHESCLTSV